MTDSNRTRMTTVAQPALGQYPVNPRMRGCRFTGETLAYRPVNVNSEELRDDRMNSDPTKINESNTGPVNGELSFPVDGTQMSIWLESMMCAAWRNTPLRENDGIADSVITDVATGTDIVTVTAGTAFVARQLVRFSGFTAAGNNGVFACTAGSATVPAFVGAGFVAEAAPPATARMKVVGFAGVAGDVTALVDGLGSTALDFTTLGLLPGQWIKIGGSADANTFTFLVAGGVKARRNAWARVSGVPTANKLPLDNLPAGWAADAGAGKTIWVFYGDTIRNGVDLKPCIIERRFMGQAVPTSIIQRDMVAGEAQFNLTTEAQARWTMTFTGMSGEATPTSLDATPDAPTTSAVMAAAVDVGRIAENGTCLSSPNWMQSMQINVNNNLRLKNGLTCGDSFGPVDMGLGSCDVTVNAPTYFGSDALLQKLFANTATNLNSRIAKNNQAVVFGLPRIIFTDGSPNATAKNGDVMLPLVGSASKDELTQAHIIIDRFEYFQG